MAMPTPCGCKEAALGPLRPLAALAMYQTMDYKEVLRQENLVEAGRLLARGEGDCNMATYHSEVYVSKTSI